MEIKCSQCREIKESKEFYKNKYRYTGFEDICKSCRYKRNHADIALRNEWNKKNKESVGKAVKAYKQRYPERQRARMKLHKAIKDGTVLKQSCKVCSISKTHAHHPDWSKPLDVIWLCPQHHKDAHYGRITV